MDLSMSLTAWTRKMVNYACIGGSQRKLWWRLAAVLTCKSIVKYELGGERLIELSSSWLPPKFPSGLQCCFQFYEVKRMIWVSGALFSLHPFSNFKYVRSPCYLVERGHSNVSTLVGHFW